MTIYSRYNPPRVEGITFTQPTRTQQHFKDECDINTIMDRYKITGVLPEIASSFDYDDYTGEFDYQRHMNAVIDAQDKFMQLPAKLRKEFDNDPGQLIDFLSDPANTDRAIELGLVNPPSPDISQSQVLEPPPVSDQAPSSDGAA